LLGSARIAVVLAVRSILRSEGVSVADVVCCHRAGPGAVETWTGGYAIVLVRRGCFVHRDELGAKVLDANHAYFVRPGAEQRYDHPHDHGDDCTTIEIEPHLLAAAPGGPDAAPAGAVPIAGALDLEHRLLLARARRDRDEHELFERALAIVAGALADASAPGTLGRESRPSARRLVDSAREALAEQPGRSLTELAAALSVSPFHLSRSFRAVAGSTMARHRRRLRARDAMERLAGGERDLARLAADTGFADQSHMSRVLRAETGETPARLRALLGGR
jgi:AraC-like DNA-binding protein